MNISPETKVTFKAALHSNDSDLEVVETFRLKDIGVDPWEHRNVKDIRKSIDAAYDEWLSEIIDCSWSCNLVE